MKTTIIILILLTFGCKKDEPNDRDIKTVPVILTVFNKGGKFAIQYIADQRKWHYDTIAATNWAKTIQVRTQDFNFVTTVSTLNVYTHDSIYLKGEYGGKKVEGWYSCNQKPFPCDTLLSIQAHIQLDQLK